MIAIEKPVTKFEWTNVWNQYIATFAGSLNKEFCIHGNENEQMQYFIDMVFS